METYHYIQRQTFCILEISVICTVHCLCMYRQSSADDQLVVSRATFSTLKMAANLTHILNFKHNFHKNSEPFKNKF